ncbi:putative cytokinetic ring protein SteA [Pseudonocardia sp.]|uniref:putative cytokinetic ring protein SteA n=1 Tax=Pseudonocardia sp. TaxID=60912 RepID=UPI003D0EA05B
MKLSGLLRPRPVLPGLAATARVDRRVEAVLRRVKPGEIAVIDVADLDRATAETLVEARVAAVVNASPSISGRYPTLGPDVLLAAGIVLVDGVGPEIMTLARDGARLRLLDGEVYAGEIRLGSGTVQDESTVAAATLVARDGMTHQLEAFAANTIEFMQRERALLLDGVGVPDVDVAIAGRQVLVVVPGPGHLDELARLRGYVREYRPVLIGVGAGADAVMATLGRPDLVVGDPAEMSDAALTSGADIVLQAFPDGHAPGLHRVQDLGAGAVTFPSTANPEDLALLLAAHHGAALIVTVGLSTGMAEFLDRRRSGVNASTFLTRLQLGGVIVDSSVITTLRRSRVPTVAVVLLLLAVLAVGAAALAVSSTGDALLTWAHQSFTTLLEQVRGWSR